MVVSVIFSSFMLTNERKAIQVIPESWNNFWYSWDARIAVSVSLLLQMILILLGNRRKCSTNIMLRIILWLAYNTADSVATASLSILSRKPSEKTALWAPFLLLHLGGPDTITAYSLEDNELWPRRVLQLCVQTAVAGYVLLSVWTEHAVGFMGIPMLLAGVIKSGERIGALRHASRDCFRDYLLPPEDPGPNYARYMEEYKLKKDEGFEVEVGEMIEDTIDDEETSSNHGGPRNDTTVVDEETIDEEEIGSNHTGRRNESLTEMEILRHAEKFFGIFQRLYADLILSFDEIQNSQSFLRKITSLDAFKVIEAELGFTFDLFYTKSMVVHSLPAGVILRCTTVSCSLSIFFAFMFTAKDTINSDVIITYALLAGATGLEILALYLLLRSDWAALRLGKYHKQAAVLSNKKRWSNSMAQYNLIKVCLKDRPAKCNLIQNFGIYKKFKMHQFKEKALVPDKLKELIFVELRKKRPRNFSNFEDFCTWKEDWVPKNEDKCIDDQLSWSIGAEFDKSILVWHIATDLCYYEDLNSGPGIDNRFHCEASRLISNYMVYLLVMYPFMLPSGIGQIRLRDTCAEAKEFFKEISSSLNEDKVSRSISNYMEYILKLCPFVLGSCIGRIKWRDTCIEAKDFFKEIGSSFDEKKACSMLNNVCTDIPPSRVKGDRCKSVLFDGCRLAKNLISLQEERKWSREKKWEMISQVWIEMLCYAACQCKWTDHAQQLRRGGELLTHVWLLMAHLGITQQFQVSQGHARVKLIVQ